MLSNTPNGATLVAVDDELPSEASENSTRMENALRAVLLFHSGCIWDGTAQAEWRRLTGGAEGTTKGMCDFIRSVLPAEGAR